MYWPYYYFLAIIDLSTGVEWRRRVDWWGQESGSVNIRGTIVMKRGMQCDRAVYWLTDNLPGHVSVSKRGEYVSGVTPSIMAARTPSAGVGQFNMADRTSSAGVGPFNMADRTPSAGAVPSNMANTTARPSWWNVRSAILDGSEGPPWWTGQRDHAPARG